MMRAQTAVPDNGLLDAQHYNEIFTTHGVVMILFMAMPFIIGLNEHCYTITNWST